MLDAFTKVVAQADARGEHVNAGQVDALLAMVKEGPKRLDVVNRITGNASAIVTNAARSLFDEQPQLIAPGGNAYTSDGSLLAGYGYRASLCHLRNVYRRCQRARRSMLEWSAGNLFGAWRTRRFGCRIRAENERSGNCSGK